MSEHQCDNCGGKYSESELEEKGKFGVESVPNLCQRLTPGGLTPSGVCPGCEALVFPTDPDYVHNDIEKALALVLRADALVKKEQVEGFHNERLADANKAFREALEHARELLQSYHPETTIP